MKPVIGITASRNKKGAAIVNETYIQAILKAGGNPIILPSNLVGNIGDLIRIVDGVVLIGGGDIDPTLFSEEPHIHLGEVDPMRDVAEIALAKAVLRTRKPLLGICRGLQILNVAMGGNMYQDIYSQRENTTIQHSQQAPTCHPTHFVKLKQGSLLQKIATEETIKVNSFHHQAVRDVPQPLQVCGIASDGIIEAIESTIHPFVLGVQWHPEALVQKEDKISMKIFEAFIHKSKESRG
nr:gamma-glutamyl-gamma-aminobutyrate hydrolase family protein [Sporosarcina ureilytica]